MSTILVTLLLQTNMIPKQGWLYARFFCSSHSVLLSLCHPKIQLVGKDVFILCSLMKSVPVFVLLSISILSLIFTDLNFPFPLWKPEWSSILHAQKVCLCASLFSFTSSMQRLNPSPFHTPPNFLHWILIFYIFPWEKWNAEYGGYCLLISTLRKFPFGKCILNNYTGK